MSVTRAASLLVALFALPALAAAQTPEAARVDSLFSEWRRADGPGASVAVLKNGEIVLERGYGLAQLEHGVPITPATVFHVASVTKQFTAFAAALLAEEGRLDLDADIRTYLPEVPDLGQVVTARHLVHHTSGVRDQWQLLAVAGWRLDDVITRDQILRLMAQQRELNFEPGAEYLYSNMGYTLLAEIVTRVSAQPFAEFMHERVFEPLGMQSTHMHDDHEHVVPGRAYSYAPRGDGWRNAVLSYANAGATSLFTTAGDLARWLRNYETAQVGGPAVIARMRQRGVLNSGDTIDYAFAIGRGEHRGHTTWSHGGSDAGFRTFVLHVPDARLGVVVLANQSNFDPGRLAHAVADVYLGGTYANATADRQQDSREEAPPPALSAAQLTSYVGTYYSPELETIYRVRAAGDTLIASHIRHGDIRLRASGEDQFAGDVWFFRSVAFTRAGDGRVDGFRLGGGRVRNLRFVRLAEGALPAR